MIGFLVRHLGIHHAMIVPSLLCFGVLVMAAAMPRSDEDLKIGRSG